LLGRTLPHRLLDDGLSRLVVTRLEARGKHPMIARMPQPA
jgi:hypothetical protein